jgi:hypothetical protein
MVYARRPRITRHCTTSLDECVYTLPVDKVCVPVFDVP